VAELSTDADQYILCKCGSLMSLCVQDDNGIVRTWGDVETKKKYSHIDLIHMIDGYDGERGAATAGGRGYYLKVATSM